MNNIYKTRDTSVATYIYLKGEKLIKLENVNGTFWFVFEDSPKCYLLETEFISTKNNFINKINDSK